MTKNLLGERRELDFTTLKNISYLTSFDLDDSSDVVIDKELANKILSYYNGLDPEDKVEFWTNLSRNRRSFMMQLDLIDRES